MKTSGDGDSPGDLFEETETDVLLDAEDISADDEPTGCSENSQCDDDDPCTVDSCDIDTGLCLTTAADVDGDGYPAESVDGIVCGGSDCDDSRDDIYPGASPHCDGYDHDCSGAADSDEDGDGYESMDLCLDGTDCNDSRSDIHPGADGICDGLDHDCSGNPDRDEDGDGHFSTSLCPDIGDDCDDTRADVHEGAEVFCDGIDHDCSGRIDSDEDGDGHASADLCLDGTDCDDSNPDAHPDATIDCQGFDADCDGRIENDLDADSHVAVTCGGNDCDDTDSTVYWGALEIACDGKDNDCNGEMAYTEDADQDGWPAPECTSGTGDCDDHDANIHPGAAEICDGYDQDCSGTILDAPNADDDGDGYLDSACGGDDCDDTNRDVYPGASVLPTDTCSTLDVDCDGRIEGDQDGDGQQPSRCGGPDCDDSDPEVYVGAVELCDGKDNDCDGSLSPAEDSDRDGHATEACSPPGAPFDCDDGDFDTYPGAPEICDDRDQDCDGDILDVPGADDDGDTVLDIACLGTDCNDLDPGVHPEAVGTCEPYDVDCRDGPENDRDGDGFISEACGGTDCNDTNPDIHPSPPDPSRCDPWDANCDGIPENDQDQDLFAGDACGGSDCDDTDPMIHPHASEVCGDGIDQDCDGRIDESVLFENAKLLTNAFIPDGDCYLPAITTNGLEFGVTWWDSGDGGVIAYNYLLLEWCQTGSCFWRDVTMPFGDSILGEAISGAPRPSLVWTGSHYGITWHSSDGVTSDIMLATVSPGSGDGTPAWFHQSERFPGDGTSYHPDITWTGSEFGIAWDEGPAGSRTIVFSRFNGDAVQQSPPISIEGDPLGLVTESTTPTLAWTGTRFSVTWVDYRDGAAALYMTILAPDGYPETTEFRVTTPGGNARFPDMLWAGSELAIVWSDVRTGNREIFLGIREASGAVTQPDIQVSTTSGASFYPRLTHTGSTFGIVWQDSNLDILFAQVDQSGTPVTSTITLTDGSSSSTYPDVQWSTSGFAVVWQDDASGQNEIYFNMIEPCI